MTITRTHRPSYRYLDTKIQLHVIAIARDIYESRQASPNAQRNIVLFSQGY